MRRSTSFLVVGLVTAMLTGPIFATTGASATASQGQNTTFGPPEPPGWSAAQTIDPGTGSAVTIACASSTFCVATDGVDGAARWNGSSWSAPTIVDTPPGLSLIHI